jgi:hypothetical protein
LGFGHPSELYNDLKIPSFVITLNGERVGEKS